MALYLILIGGIFLIAEKAWAEIPQTIPSVREGAMVVGPLPKKSAKEEHPWNAYNNTGWENRFFDKPLIQYHFQQRPFLNGSDIPLKSPGMLPGIKFGIEMHSFQALQSVVPPETFSKSFSFTPNQPLLQSPSTISPDYNGGFFRLIW